MIRSVQEHAKIREINRDFFWNYCLVIEDAAPLRLILALHFALPDKSDVDIGAQGLGSGFQGLGLRMVRTKQVQENAALWEVRPSASEWLWVKQKCLT